MDEGPNVLKKPWQVPDGPEVEIMEYVQRCAAMAAAFYLELSKRGVQPEGATALTQAWLRMMMGVGRQSE